MVVFIIIGKRFAELEMKLLLIEVSQKFIVDFVCFLLFCRYVQQCSQSCTVYI